MTRWLGLLHKILCSSMCILYSMSIFRLSI
nr:MAG TPA: hypothetical protein [Bacteriophage sp.]